MCGQRDIGPGQRKGGIVSAERGTVEIACFVDGRNAVFVDGAAAANVL